MTADLALLANAGRLALFADLEREQLAEIVGALQEVSYEEGQWVLRRGEMVVGMHIIVDGEAGVVLEETELATLSKGSFFGEISALLGEPTAADIVARTRLRCLVVPTEDVEPFLLANPRVMYRMLQTEARRVRTTDELRI
jgi:CRP/FNR family transcriptional regulator, cyclic AMP receptor protein